MQFSSMSPVEIQFIRLYVTTLKREYYLLKSVIDLMHPTGLGVKSFTEATNMSLALDAMQKDFDTALHNIQKKDRIRKIKTVDGPTIEELTALFSLSFFKIVTTIEKDKTPVGTKITSDGWYSGKPNEWKKSFALYKNAPKDAGFVFPDLLSNFFNTLLKFFPFDKNYKKWHEGPINPTKKLWPPDDENEQYFENDVDDDGELPFNMFFDDDDD